MTEVRTKCEFAALAQKAAFVRVAELNFRLHRVAHLQRSRLCSSGTICPFFQGDTNRGVRMRRTNPNTIATTIALHSNQLFDKRSLMACLYSVIRLRRPSSESIVPLHLRPLMNQRFLPNQFADGDPRTAMGTPTCKLLGSRSSARKPHTAPTHPTAS